MPCAVVFVWVVPAWGLLAALALTLALIGGLIDGVGLLAVLALAAGCLAANRAGNRGVRLLAHALTLGLCAGCFLHVIPGFANPRVLTDVVVGADSVPYTKYLNFDKGMAGLLLLGMYVPDRVERDEGRSHAVGFLWRFTILALAAALLAVLSGYVRWDPKLPSWWPTWIWSMLLLTALPEEALFRGVIQSWMAGGTSDGQRWPAIVMAGIVFGLAHLAGGPLYVLVASAAGVGYGWIYASTRSIAAAIAAHAGLNAVHFFCFSYPALVR
jgi:membrane protease YdiL (CAAX protease family)